jgi:hypothetical protein
MKIATRVQSYPQATLVYSPPGVGKTEFAAHFPKPVFLMIDLEIGLKTLIREGRVPADTAHKEEAVSSFDELLEDLEWFADAQHDHETLVVDTLNSCQLLVKRKVKHDQFWNREDKFDAFAKGWERCAEPWNHMLHMFNRVRARGMRVVALAHSEVTMMRNPDGEDYQAHTPMINQKHLWVPTNAFFDNVFFMNLEVCSVTDKQQQAVKDKSHRLLYTQADAGHFAKNRFGLNTAISCGKSGRDAYQNFYKAIMAKRPKPEPKPPVTETKQPTTETAPAREETKQPTTETAPAREETKQPEAVTVAGPEWVQTWHNRITATDKLGPTVSTFGDILTDFASAPEPDQVEHFPGIFQAWVKQCLKVEPVKGAEQVKKKLGTKHGLPGTLVDSMTLLLEQA